MREIMDCNEDPNVEEVAVMASAQVGKSEGLNNIVGKTIDLDPGPIMLVQPRIEDAEGYSKKRIATMIRDTPTLREKISPVRSKDGLNSILFKKFPAGFLKISGANAPASLASDSIRLLVMDEIDRMTLSTSEGDPCELAKKRTNNFKTRRKIFSFSTPTDEKTSRVYKLWKQSDQRYFMMPCPHCEKRIRFQWKTDEGVQILKWENNDPSTAKMTCIECGVLIEEKYKWGMLQKGEWVPTNPESKLRGYHIWEAYSPWRKWSEIVEDFLKVKDYPESLKVWINTSLGEVWVTKEGEIADWKRLYDRREQYPTGTVPDGAYFLVCGVDVQGDRIEAEVVGYGKNLESWSIEKFLFEGNPQHDEVWAKLEELLSKQWPKSDKVSLPIRLMAIDSGAYTQRVYNFVRRFPKERVIAIKGYDNLDAMAVPGNKVDVNVRGVRHKRSLRIWKVGVNIIKSEIMGFLRAEKPEDGQPFPPGFFHFPEYGEEYFKQLTAEHIERERDRDGYFNWVWKKHYERNETLDLRVYARAAAHLLGIDRMTEEKWEKLKNQTSPAPVVSSASVSAKTVEKAKKKKVRSQGSSWL